jgi:hypothetical protein
MQRARRKTKNNAAGRNLLGPNPHVLQLFNFQLWLLIVGCCSAKNPAPAGYFLAAPAFAAASAYFLVKRSTRPAVSTSFCLPVKNGWQFEQISTRIMSPLMVERVWNVLPQAQCTVTG